MTKIKGIISPITGRVWMDRNIGAKKKVKSRLDNPKTYGDKFTYEEALKEAKKYKKLGYRVPTKGELKAEGESIHHNLKLPRSGYSRLTTTGYREGNVYGANGYYWSSTESSRDYAWELDFHDSGVYMKFNNKTYKFSVRLIKDK
jgi:hypothetical protein